MNCMATWEDGPEYAPIERPSDFQSPDASPLTIAPPHTQLAAWAPKNRPVFDSPAHGFSQGKPTERWRRKITGLPGG